MDFKIIFCEKCFSFMKEVFVNQKEYEDYHLKILENRVDALLTTSGLDVEKFKLTFLECNCVSRGRIVIVS